MKRPGSRRSITEHPVFSAHLHTAHILQPNPLLHPQQICFRRGTYLGENCPSSLPPLSFESNFCVSIHPCLSLNESCIHSSVLSSVLLFPYFPTFLLSFLLSNVFLQPQSRGRIRRTQDYFSKAHVPHSTSREHPVPDTGLTSLHSPCKYDPRFLFDSPFRPS